MKRYTYLGVVLERRLSWNEHVSHLISKAAKKVGVLGRIRQNITTNTANTVYKSLISPFLEYCDTVWTCCGKVNASSLEKLQRRAARIIVKSSNSEQAMSSLAFETLADRRDKHILKFVKKCIEGKAPQFFSNYFKSNHDISKRITRQKHHLHILKKSFKYQGCVIFNKFQSK